MTRKEHEASTKSKILKVARRLLMEQGYQNTTIRQIVRECDSKIGTVYHYFKNKEDIFLHISEGMFDRISLKADEGVEQADSCRRFAREIRLHLDIILQDDQSRELYLVGYHSPHISELLLHKHKIRSRELFARYNPNFTEEDYALTGLFIKGFLQAIAVERGNDPDLGTEAITAKAIRTMLRLFNVPEEEIVAVLGT